MPSNPSLWSELMQIGDNAQYYTQRPFKVVATVVARLSSELHKLKFLTKELAILRLQTNLTQCF